jgi:hypothetical protein
MVGSADDTSTSRTGKTRRSSGALSFEDISVAKLMQAMERALGLDVT